MGINLPRPLTTFVGRGPELAAIDAALSGSRLVTLVGPGGCGKTRLAIEAATRAPEGAFWVDLTTTEDPSAVPALVASAVGVLLAPDQRAVASLTRQVGDQRMLICLDNCEHVLAAAASVAAELAGACPGVTVLATSREPLGVPGEAVWRVPSLTADDAVALFDARSGQPGGSPEVRAAVRTACIRLDGIPLAIELAAAWSGTLSVPEILHGLDDRFALLVRGPRGVAARHQTLAASMAWSHDLLDDADRVLFRRLAACHDGFTVEAARGVCGFGDLDPAGVLPGLRRLVEKSLVIADTRGSVARYRMLETIRGYATARLTASGELAEARDRHLATFLALVERAAPLLDEDKDAWRAAIGQEQENLRAALDHGLSRADPEPGRRLAAGLAWLWHLGGHGPEGIAVLRRAIASRPADRSGTQARLLAGLALVADTTQPVGLEYDAARAAEELATAVGDARTACLARLLSAVGVFYQDFAHGRRLAEEARDLGRAAGDGFVVDGATALLGIIAHLRDEHEEAVPLLRAAVDGLLPRGDRGVAATALGFLAASALHTGDLARARALAAQGVEVARPLADYHRVGSAAAMLALVEGTAGRLDAAHAAVDPVIRLIDDAESPPFVPNLARVMGQLRLWVGRPAEAADWFRRETDWLDRGDETYLSPQTLTGLAAALRALGATDDAATVAARALASARELGMPKVEADALEQLALLRQAEDLHHEALAVRTDRGLWPSTVDSLEALAGLACAAGSVEEAARLLGACARARAAMGLPPAATDLGLAQTQPAAWAEGASLSLVDAIGYARRARGTRGRPASGWASLTPTEQSVVRLAVAGLSNPDIGTRLFMSRSTVKTHLSHVYAKLGVANRTELATLAGPHLG